MVQYLADIYHAISSALQGMAITIKHIVRKPVTLQYPDERWVLPERFRGFVHLDTYYCNACTQCAKACPVSCIYIETEGKGKDRYMTRYAVDFNKCIWCGFCSDPCPTNAVTMSHDYDHSLYFRKNLVYEFISPDNPMPTHKDRRREAGLYVEEKVPKAKPEKPAADTPAAEKDAPDKAAAEKPAADKPATETPAAEKPKPAVPAPEPSAAGESANPAGAEPPAGKEPPAGPSDPEKEGGPSEG
jgi:NADH-quinone oxidoreductase subunit I/NAD(P)H-quinone oxidoreductase subunit I